MTIIPIMTGAFVTVSKGLLKGLDDLEVGGQSEYWESWILEETSCHSNSTETPSANTDVKNPKGVNNNNFVTLTCA